MPDSQSLVTLFSSALPLLIVVAIAAYSIRILREYERGVVFLLGRFWKVKGPGLVIIVPFIQQMVRMDLRTRVHDVPPQDVISKDNVSVRVNAVVYFRVLDPEKAIIQVEQFEMATSQFAQPPCVRFSANTTSIRCWPNVNSSTMRSDVFWTKERALGGSR